MEHLFQIRSTRKPARVRPYMRKQKKAYATDIAHSHTGVIKQTGPSGHYTWWIYEGVEPHTYFKYEKL